MFRSLSIGLLVVPLTGCIHRNADCLWPTEDVGPLSLADSGDARHLLDDVRMAEDLAIRYGDIRWAPGPTRWQQRDARCLEPTLARIADRHNISLQAVLASRERLDEPRRLDPLVVVPVALFAAALGSLVVRRLSKRFSYREEPLANAVGTALASVLVGGVTLAFGRFWEGGIEAIRLGTTHLTYRGLRLRWTQDPVELFLIGAALVWVVALARYRPRARLVERH